MKIFNIESLYAGYDKTPVLKEITTSIKEGDFTGIIGSNGAGKSTFLKTLCCLLQPISGKIEFLGKPLFDYESSNLARQMAMVPQFVENILPFHVNKFVGTGRFPFQNFWDNESKEDKEIVHNSLVTTRTLHLKDRLLTELSGGELQLVCIARALAQSKKLILFDEPISNLDINHTIQIMDLLHELNSNGATILTVLHNINIASDYCSNIMALKNGTIFFEGIPDNCVTGDSISSLFNKDCSVKKNPVTGRPYIFPHPGFTKNLRSN